MGAFPKGFMEWITEMGWLLDNRCYLCAGLVEDPEAFKVDVRSEVNPDLVADATNTELPDNHFDCVIVDPPYSKDLAKKLYKTEKYYYDINKFAKEAARICKPGGHVITYSRLGSLCYPDQTEYALFNCMEKGRQMTTTKITCPICKSEGRTSSARYLWTDKEKRVAHFQCNDIPAHVFKESLDKEEK
jgi:hypothetical protein